MATIPAGLVRHLRNLAKALLMACTVLLVSATAQSDAGAAPAKAIEVKIMNSANMSSS